MLTELYIEALLLDAAPPDPELEDLIEQAFLEGQIDGLRADLAYLWLWGEERADVSRRAHFFGP